MTIVYYALTIVTVTLLSLLRTILDAEYTWWGAKLARAITRVAGRLVPRADRTSRAAEWLAELEVLQQQSIAGVLMALGLLTAAANMRATAVARRTLRLVRREPCPQTVGVAVLVRDRSVNITVTGRDVTTVLQDLAAAVGMAVSHTAGTDTVILTATHDGIHTTKVGRLVATAPR
jgi:hypothetical protein